MTHIEGPIVQSFYDMALISWGEVLNPPLPLLKGGGGAPKEGEEYAFNEDNRYLKGISKIVMPSKLFVYRFLRHFPCRRRKN